MATSILEQTRQYHEDIETAEKVASKLLTEKSKRPPKYRPLYDHAILKTLCQAQDSARRLLELYSDRDGLRKEEISILGGQKRFGDVVSSLEEQNSDENAIAGGDDDRTVWLNFYDELKLVKDGHKKTVNGLTDALAANEMLRDITTLSNTALELCDGDQLFSAEEYLGRRVDMAPLFLDYTNLTKYRKHRESEFKQNELGRLKKKLLAKKLSNDEMTEQLNEAMEELHFTEIDYISYLKIFDDFGSIPRYCKYKEPQYESYLHHLLEYLQNFLKRLNPLSNHDRMLEHFDSDFQFAWEKKVLPSWEIPTHKMETYALPTDHLFATKGTLTSHIQGKKYKKALSVMQSMSIEEQQQRIVESEEYDKEIAKKEFFIEKYKDILSSVIQRTIEHLQKKQSRTLRELDMDAEDSDVEDTSAIVLANRKVEEDVLSEPDSDEEKPIYNPLNLPLGWDGKPIPFWLYKLHGLGVEYKCEICGNYSYWGRRAFERHFQEWRHAFGMRCLKIPNTVHFKEITKIEDAIVLYEKLKKEAEIQAFKADQDVECEDAEGNVMSARTYEDLRRQGLL